MRVDRRFSMGFWALAGVAALGACSQASPVPSETQSADAAPARPRPAPAPPSLQVTEAPAPVFAIHSVLDLDQPIEPGDYAWAGGGLPGPTQVVVDIAAQMVYVYRGGVEIGRSSMIYGADDKPTPHGIFPILEKDADHVSNLYDAPMPYMLRLTWDGIALHGSEVDARYATHGCIGLPEEFAQILFDEVVKGDQVLVTEGWLPELYGNGQPADTVFTT